MAGFTEHMDDDLDTPWVVGQLFELVRRANAALDEGDEAAAAPLAAAVREMAAAVGIELRESDEGEIPADVLDTARRRDEARAAKDWAAADSLRAELEAAGWVVEDTPSGTQVRRA